MQIEFHPAADLPTPDEWVLAFWRHMSPGYQWQGKKTFACGGWFPTRYREGRGWQAQFLSYRTYPRGKPELWTPMLRPETEYLERIMRAHYGGTELDCPGCGAEKVQFQKLHSRRVYACPECRFQIAPTANTILHDTRTPLSSWFRADQLLAKRPRMTVKELQAFLGVTYKCAWRIRSKIKAARAASAMSAGTAATTKIGVVHEHATAVGGTP